MDTERWQKLEGLFLEATELETTGRDAFLANACADDPELLAELRAMLEATGEQHRLSLENRLFVAQERELDAVRNVVVDRYEIGSLIGRGGMGEVYRARRSDGAFDQEVALKLISGTIPGRAAVRRFQAERQILARLEHPNIARLLDGGASGDGRPYLVMQLVEGTPLTEYCDAKGLGLRDRLRLFRTVCGAVQYAHRNLVVHRDLKPSNILVTAEGDPVLLDFGIAKLLEADDDGALTQTATGSVLMTPEAAAPEQVSGVGVTTATDVYGLGVLLYRLLTGHHPFGPTKPSVPELRDWILEGRRTRPSAVAPASAKRALRGELDNIALKALHPDPARRYGTAGELGDDIARYLDHEPVRAAPDSVGYRVRKFVRRHPVGVSAATAIVALVTGFAAVTAEQSRRTEAERDRAEQMVQVLVDLFQTSDPTFDANRDTMRVSTFLARSRQQVIDDLARQPELQVRMKHVLGKVYTAREQYPQARELLSDAFDQHRELVDRPDSVLAALSSDLGRILSRIEGPASVPFLRESLELQRTALGERHPAVGYAMATLAHVVEDRSEGMALLEAALDIQRESLPPVHLELANSLNELGVFAYLSGEYEAAANHWFESRSMLEEIRPADNPDAMTVTQNIAQAYLQLGDIERALEINRDLLERRKRVLGDSSMAVGDTHNNIGANHTALHDYESAEASFRSALAAYDVAFGDELTGVAGQEKAASTARNLGVAIQLSGRPGEAVPWLDRAIDRQVRFAGTDAEPTIHMRAQRANILLDLEQTAVALDTLLRLSSLAAERAGEDGSPVSALVQTWLGRAQWMAGNGAEAEGAFRTALEFRERVMGPDTGIAAEARAGLGLALLLQGDRVEARSLIESSLEAYRAYSLVVPTFLAQIEGQLQQ
ncbi:MAG: serine/threonine-protein kinase [Gemmatimonadetes bacterium]|nr:serine/threonine-protein kinase [Gemmatimonadota bacterium]